MFLLDFWDTNFDIVLHSFDNFVGFYVFDASNLMILPVFLVLFHGMAWFLLDFWDAAAGTGLHSGGRGGGWEVTVAFPRGDRTAGRRVAAQ